MEDLIKKDKFQVFLFQSPCNLPISLVPHHWFVINKQGSISRWEVLFRKNLCPTSWAHLHMNAFKPFQGIEVLPFSDKWHWTGKLLEYIEGDENSEAARAAVFIESSKDVYRFKECYSLLGPNSNTYVQWILNHISGFKTKLPWNSFGKSVASAM